MLVAKKNVAALVQSHLLHCVLNRCACQQKAISTLEAQQCLPANAENIMRGKKN